MAERRSPSASWRRADAACAPSWKASGEAGARGFGRLSREMELANTRLAAFARRAGLALGAAAAAATASLGLIVRSTAESAAQIRQFAQVANATPEALQRWSAGARTVGIEQEKLADILKDVNDRVGDFLQTGGGPMADFFENVAPRAGVTADQFARLSARRRCSFTSTRWNAPVSASRR